MGHCTTISVIMSAYNAETFVGRAIESILGQSYEDFEFIIINDGSTDNTLAVLHDYSNKDPRIQIINQDNIGLTVSLNKGISSAKGYYIARQDADDVSLPDRLKIQLNLMERDTKIILCGGNCFNIYETFERDEWGYEEDDQLNRSVFIKAPFPHSTAFFIKHVANELGGYDETFKTSQDMELWMRMAKVGCISMIKKPILERYVLSESISKKRRLRQFFDAYRARWAHNPRKIFITFFSFRSLLISLLPIKYIHFLKKLQRRS